MSTPLRLVPVLASVLALVLPLAACAEPEDTSATDPGVSESASDPASEPTSEPTSEPISEPEGGPLEQSGPVEVSGSAGVKEAVVVSGSEVGGEVSPLAFPLETRQERADFGAAFQRGFGDEVAQAARSLDAAAGTTLWGAVAAVACEGPASVRIDAGEAGFEVTAQLKKSTVQCLVPVTYVVVFAAPSA